MENKYNLKFNRVVTNGNLILFEIENAKGEKRYFIHRGCQSMEFSDDANLLTFDNKTVINELIRSHNEVSSKLLSSTGFTFTYINVDGILILVQRLDEEDNAIWQWIRA